MLKKIYEEKTKKWWFGITLASSHEEDLCYMKENNREYKNVLTVVTPWTYRNYELPKNIIDLAFNYRYNGKDWYSNRCYGITIRRNGEIHLDWNRHDIDMCDSGYFRIYTPWFTSKDVIIKKIYHSIDTTQDLDEDHSVNYLVTNNEGKRFILEASIQSRTYGFFNNKPMRFLTNLFNMDETFINAQLEIYPEQYTKHSDEYYDTVSNVSIAIHKYTNDTHSEVVTKYCKDHELTLINRINKDT